MTNPSDPFDFGPGQSDTDGAGWGWGDSPPPPPPPDGDWAREDDQPTPLDNEWTPVGPGPSSGVQTTSAPIGLIVVASAAVFAAGALLAVMRGSPIAMAAAWFLAGPICILSTGFFFGADAERRADPYYAEQSWTKSAPVAVAVVGLILAATSAWFFADWAARQ